MNKANCGKHLRLLATMASLLLNATSAARASSLSAHTGEGSALTDLSEAHAAHARRLDEDHTCSAEETSVFVDSTIANLNNPIGGCYENATAMNGYSTYSLGGGGPRKGQAWIYVTTSGFYEIAMVGEIDGETGEVVTMETLCEANNINAASVSGPTDAQLEFGWQCAYFQNGVTNRGASDFDGVLCGCSDRTISGGDESSSSSGGIDSTAIAIGSLSAVAVLFALVCCCFIRIRRRTKEADQEAVHEDYAFKA